MDEHAVVVVGAGPTGLTLAAELAIAGVEVTVLERRTDQHVDGSRAGGLHARTIEVFDQRGVAERFLSAGYTAPAVGYAGNSLDISDFPTRHNYVLALWQSRFEPILADWVDELGVTIMRDREVVSCQPEAGGVHVQLSDGTALRSQFVVGCDGGRSVIRKSAGIEFAGLDASMSWLIAEVEMDDEPEVGMRQDSAGSHGLSRLE